LSFVFQPIIAIFGMTQFIIPRRSMNQ
jgi:hypothetical protein